MVCAALGARAAVIAKLALASLLINLLGLATPLFMMLVINRVIGHGAPTKLAPMMALLAAVCWASMRSIFRCGWRAAGCRHAPARASTR